MIINNNLRAGRTDCVDVSFWRRINIQNRTFQGYLTIFKLYLRIKNIRFKGFVTTLRQHYVKHELRQLSLEAASTDMGIVCRLLILFIVMETVTGGFVNIKTNCKTIQKLQRAWFLCPSTFRGCIEKLKHPTVAAYQLSTHKIYESNLACKANGPR
uniref:Uncharacterized protein n=1 Tax=Glossina pallidipes TaxID=7398 RepID=A0A1A9Z540_GLOPL